MGRTSIPVGQKAAARLNFAPVPDVDSDSSGTRENMEKSGTRGNMENFGPLSRRSVMAGVNSRSYPQGQNPTSSQRNHERVK